MQLYRNTMKCFSSFGPFENVESYQRKAATPSVGYHPRCRWLGLGRLTNSPGCHSQICQLVLNAVGEMWGYHEHHAEAHIEDTIHLGSLNLPQPLQPAKDRRNLPAVPADLYLHEIGRAHV